MAYGAGKIIWGFGDTKEAALEDGRRWIDDWNDWAPRKASLWLRGIPCDSKVELRVDEVSGEGAAQDWHILNGKAVLKPGVTVIQ
jgi:hypothetical protein